MDWKKLSTEKHDDRVITEYVCYLSHKDVLFKSITVWNYGDSDNEFVTESIVVLNNFIIETMYAHNTGLQYDMFLLKSYSS